MELLAKTTAVTYTVQLCGIVPEMSFFSHIYVPVDPFQPGVGTAFKIHVHIYETGLVFNIYHPTSAIGSVRFEEGIPPYLCCITLRQFRPLWTFTDHLSKRRSGQETCGTGFAREELDWKKWTFKAVPVFLALLGASTLIGAGTILPLVLSIAIMMALIIHDGIMEIIVPVRDKIAGNAFKEVASDGLLGLGRDLGGKVADGLLGLGTTLAAGLVISTLVMAYRNKDGRISNENLSNRVENKRVEGEY